MWEAGGLNLIGRVLGSPALARAVRALANDMLALGDADPVLHFIFNDAGRYVVTDWAMYLAAADELTLPALKALGVRSGIVSAGRVRAIAQVLEHLGYLVVVEPAAGRRPARYRASDGFRDAWRRHHRTALQAAALIEPAARPMADATNDPRLYSAFCRFHGEILVRASEGDADNLRAPFFSVLYQSLAGIQLVWLMLAAMEDDAFPPRTPLRLSIEAAARRFDVSTGHVRRVLKAAEAKGLITRDERGVTLTDETGGLLGHIYASQFVMLLTAAALTLRP